MTRPSTIIFAATLALTWGAVAQPRTPWPSVSPPIILQLDGTLHQTTAAARKAGFTVVSFGFVGSEDGKRWLGVGEARTVGPDQTLDGKDVLNELAPLRPNLLVAGPEAMVNVVEQAPEGARIRMEGLVRRGSRTYYLRTVELDPAPRSRLDGRHHDLAVALARAEGGERRR